MRPHSGFLVMMGGVGPCFLATGEPSKRRCTDDTGSPFSTLLCTAAERGVALTRGDRGEDPKGNLRCNEAVPMAADAAAAAFSSAFEAAELSNLARKVACVEDDER